MLILMMLSINLEVCLMLRCDLIDNDYGLNLGNNFMICIDKIDQN